MNLHLAPVGLGELPERVLVPRARPCERGLFRRGHHR